MEMFGRILMIYLSAIPAASTMPAMCWDDSALSLRDDKQVPSPINCSAVVMMSLDNHNGTVTEILLYVCGQVSPLVKGQAVCKSQQACLQFLLDFLP